MRVVERRVRLEHAREAVGLERIDRVERLRRRRGGELDELGSAVEAHERVGEVVRAPVALAASASACSSRFGESRTWTNAAPIGAKT